LADSLPKQVLLELEKRALGTANEPLPRAELEKVRARRARLIEAYLDRGAGKCYLARPKVAELVSTALKFGKDRDYRLLGWCVMPNHVHVVAKLLPGRRLSTILHSWKSHSAKEANKLLLRSGEFWEREYYDRLIRTEDELGRTLRYIKHNPVKAGLKNCPWVEVRGQDARATAGEDAGATR
jgi:REP element-mobilizing transposase RayT